jgi:dsRNA-specific ribonuclease
LGRAATCSTLKPRRYATTGLLRSCLTTLKQACARRGLHWIRVSGKSPSRTMCSTSLGIALDLSKGQGGQTVGNTRSKADQEAAQQAQQQGKPAKNT